MTKEQIAEILAGIAWTATICAFIVLASVALNIAFGYEGGLMKGMVWAIIWTVLFWANKLLR